MRDNIKIEKLRVVKVIHAFIHKRVFIFYTKPQMFLDLSKMLTEAFGFSKMLNEIQIQKVRQQTIGEVDLFVQNCEALVCTDIIFALLNDAFNKTEPIVYGFTMEAKKLNTDIDKRKENERIEVIGRACIAKEMTIELLQEIKNKSDLLE